MENIKLLIEKCRRKDGSWSLFKRCCLCDPKKFFKKINLELEYLSLSDKEKEVFESEKNFFDSLVYFGYKKEKDKCVKNIYQKCKICSKEVDFLDITQGYKNTCSKKCEYELYKKSNKQKYGIENPFQNPELRAKLLENFINKKEEIVLKRKETYKKKTGYESPAQNPEIVLKRKETYKKKTGYDHNMKNPNCLKEREAIFQRKYNVKHQSLIHIKNIERIDDIEFLTSNFINSKTNRIMKQKIMDFFNISESYYQSKILPLLRENGYSTAYAHGDKENCFLDDLEKSLGRILIRQYKIPNTNFKVDGYDPETNSVFEFLGDYWHGNPEVYDYEEINGNNGISFKELYDKTFKRLNEIKKLGYSVKYMWENDWIKNNNPINAKSLG